LVRKRTYKIVQDAGYVLEAVEFSYFVHIEASCLSDPTSPESRLFELTFVFCMKEFKRESLKQSGGSKLSSSMPKQV